MSAASTELIEAVWARGRVMPEADGAVWRQDECGAWIRREHFGREDSDFGWKLELVTPGSASEPRNLRPFHWRNGYDVANGQPRCGVVADRSDVPAERYAMPPRNRAL
ncbi:MAG: hypothetical protein OHK0044_32210 [Burkholderiaceae bacterium]